MLSRTAFGRRLISDSSYRAIFLAVCSLALNLAYAIYHGALGLLNHSWWFLAMFGYYAVLGTARFFAVLFARSVAGHTAADERFVKNVCGALLLLLGCVLSGVNYVSLVQDTATRYGTIPMITIAAYTFTKLTLAILRAIRQRRSPSPLLSAIRGIGYAEVAVSVLTLQRSMLVSFEGMPLADTRIMNACLGFAVCAFICYLAFTMLIERK